MTGRHRKPATSAINVAKVAFTGAIIGGGGLALAVQASAAPALQDAPRTSALHLRLAPAPADPAVPPVPPAPPNGPPPPGPPPVPPVPTDDSSQSPGQLGYLREIWHEFHQNPNDVINGLLPQPTDPSASPPPGPAPGPQPSGPQGPPPP